MRSDPAGSPNQEPQEKKRWVEPVTALLMALATLSTAWCSYQSAAFTRRSNRLMNEFNSLERRASLHTMQGMQQATIQPPCSWNSSRHSMTATKSSRTFTPNVFHPMCVKLTTHG